MKERLRAQSDVALYGYRFEKDYRCATATALEQQSKYEKKLRYHILEQTPNYRARLRESLKRNAMEIEFHKERVRRKEEEERLVIVLQVQIFIFHRKFSNLHDEKISAFSPGQALTRAGKEFFLWPYVLRNYSVAGRGRWLKPQTWRVFLRRCCYVLPA